MVLRRLGIMTVTGLAFIAIPTAISNNILDKSTLDTVIVAGYGFGAFAIWNTAGVIKDLMSTEDNEEDYNGLYVMDETEYTDALYNTAKVVKNSVSEQYQARESVIRDYYESKLSKASEPKTVTTTTNNTYTYYNTNNTAYLADRAKNEYIDTKIIEG